MLRSGSERKSKPRFNKQTMTVDPFLVFTSGVQALRRRAEGLSWGLGGALGVAADPYPHQVGTVERILKEARIRHLIADEVGLGKTVQALMIINALRWQNPKHKTVIVAPERLVGQWQTEAWTRGHVRAAVVGSEEVERGEDPAVLLVRPRDIQENPGILDPSNRHLLIVDEPQSIQLEVMEAIARSCSGLRTSSPVRFRQVLVLSATPRLSDPRWRSIIFEMIEPERTGISQFQSREISDYLAELEAEALSRLQETPSELRLAEQNAIYSTSSINRHISRQSRRDWSQYLPTRTNEIITFEPAQAEIKRLELIDEIISNSPSRRDISAAPWIQVRAMLRSRRSARAAMDQLGGQSPDDKVSAARRLASDDPVDTRFEALLDLLSTDWSRRPDERFIIVAGDAPTIDMLNVAIPRYIEELREDGSIAVLKRPPSATDETAIDIQYMHEAITPFIDGAARLLIIGDWVQAGLNLHHTSRNIIFYSLPWDPVVVDQLIGRIDRLRRGGLRRGDAGKFAGEVRIWRLIMRGAPEERVSKLFDAVRLFQRPLPQLSEHDAQRLADSIENAARGEIADAALKELELMSAAWDEEGLQSQLSDYDPSTSENIVALVDRKMSSNAIEPSIVSEECVKTVTLKAEIANEGWLRILGKGNIYQISNRHDREDPDLAFKTLWYAHGNPGQPIPLSEIDTRNWMTDHAVFLAKRRALSVPPRAKVITDDGEEHGRLLRFFDHGESIHDELVQGFHRLCHDTYGKDADNPEFRAIIANGHHLEPYASKAILLSVGYADASVKVEEQGVPAELLRLVDDERTTAQRARLEGDLSEYIDGIHSDQRWLNAMLPPSLILRASVLEGSIWQPVPDANVADFFKPLGRDGRFSPAPRSVPQSRALVSPSLIHSGKVAHEQSIASELPALLKASFSQFKSGLEARVKLIDFEYRDLVELRKFQWESRRSDTVGEAQREMFKGQVLGLERRLEAARLMRKSRREQLLQRATAAIKRRPQELWHLNIRFVVQT
ncbi:SNF2-related protein [Rhizobium johnstonii]|uniref:SNF2-related protein n=1 Tax=Rhizobium johnstonii TaxID=3019933 RepID=UPI003F962D21